MNDGTLKRVIQYMKSAKLVEIYQYPLEDLNPNAGPCVYKKGNITLKHVQAHHDSIPKPESLSRQCDFDGKF